MITINSGEKTALEVLRKNGIMKPEHINLTSIALKENIVIEEKRLDSLYGRILMTDKCGIITVSTIIKTPEKRDFTIAHELGHFYHDGPAGFFCNKCDIKYHPRRDKENAANEFASGLLMPEEFINKYVRWQGSGKETIELMKRIFRTSISASAIRYALKGEKPICAVMSSKGKVDWVYKNPKFRYKYIQVGDAVPYESLASYFFTYGVNDFDGVPESRDAAIWFSRFPSSYGRKMTEQVIPMPGNDNSILTLMWEG